MSRPPDWVFAQRTARSQESEKEQAISTSIADNHLGNSVTSAAGGNYLTLLPQANSCSAESHLRQKLDPDAGGIRMGGQLLRGSFHAALSLVIQRT
jgi:hypothetical protein